MRSAMATGSTKVTFTEWVRPPPRARDRQGSRALLNISCVLTVNTDVPEPASDAGLKVPVVRARQSR